MKMIGRLSVARASRIPLLAEEGWREAPGWSVRQNQSYAGLTTPSAPLRWLRDIFLLAQPPLLCEEGNTQYLGGDRNAGKLETLDRSV